MKGFAERLPELEALWEEGCGGHQAIETYGVMRDDCLCRRHDRLKYVCSFCIHLHRVITTYGPFPFTSWCKIGCRVYSVRKH
jgi:hypothetical protein